jgi:5-methyltetrahydrofolate--homocysteine methyltransferase
MREVIEALENANLKPKVKVIIGGAPITQSFADQIISFLIAPNV